MVSIIKRAAKLKARLLAIRQGPGAAVLPSEVKRIHMDFAFKGNQGHMGPRRFWRQALPRLKYHNPAVSMTINRTNENEGPALMTVYFTSPSESPSKAASPTASSAPTSSTTSPNLSTAHATRSSDAPSSQRVETIEMKNRTESEILQRLLELTRAMPVDLTPEDEELAKELAERERQAQIDATRVARVLAQRKREEALLAQAKGEQPQAQAI